MHENRDEPFELDGPATVTPATVGNLVGRWNAHPFEGRAPGGVLFTSATRRGDGWTFLFIPREEPEPWRIGDERTGLVHVIPAAPPRADFAALFPPSAVVVGLGPVELTA